jgi:hypothetical protein
MKRLAQFALEQTVYGLPTIERVEPLRLNCGEKIMLPSLIPGYGPDAARLYAERTTELHATCVRLRQLYACITDGEEFTMEEGSA